MQKRVFIPHIILISLMVVTAFALAFTVDVNLSDEAGIRMYLPPELEGGWIGDELRYSHNSENPKQYKLSELEIPDIDPETGEELFKMSIGEYKALPKDTTFTKSIYTNDAGGTVFVSIVLSGKERNSIHRPQRCLVGQGYTIVGSEVFEIPLEGRDPLKVKILKTTQDRTPKGEDVERVFYHGYYAYWFVGQNRETCSHYKRMFWLAWDRVVHSVAHKWAYIAVSGEREEGDEEYKQVITTFIQKLYPHILRDLSNDS